MPPTIRIITESDRPILAEIYRTSRLMAFPHRDPESFKPEDFDDDTKGELVLVAETEGKPCGFLSIWVPDSFFHHLYIDPAFIRMGMGRALLAEGMRHVPRAATLKCLKSNSHAMAFYQKLGWRRMGEGESPDGPYHLMEAP